MVTAWGLVYGTGHTMNSDHHADAPIIAARLFLDSYRVIMGFSPFALCLVFVKEA